MQVSFTRPAAALVPPEDVFKEVLKVCRKARAAAVLSSCTLEIRVVDADSRDFDRLHRKPGLFVLGIYTQEAGRKGVDEDVAYFKEEVTKAFAVAELERALGV